MNERAGTSYDTTFRYHAICLLITIFSAGAAVPAFYTFRMSRPLLIFSLIAFMGLPLIIAAKTPHPSPFFLRLSLAMLLACPAVYFLLDFWELGRDMFFFMTAVYFLFVSATWSIDSWQSAHWGRACIATIGVLIGLAAIFVMTLMFLFME